jgi:hypothetical protein
VSRDVTRGRGQSCWLSWSFDATGAGARSHRVARGGAVMAGGGGDQRGDGGITVGAGEGTVRGVDAIHARAWDGAGVWPNCGRPHRVLIE